MVHQEREHPSEYIRRHGPRGLEEEGSGLQNIIRLVPVRIRVRIRVRVRD